MVQTSLTLSGRGFVVECGGSGMETSRFDSLVRALGEGGATRRTLARLMGGALLAALPLAGEAKKKKKKKKCKPDSTAVTCNGKCGSVTNNCKQAVACGSCNCKQQCDVCFTCQAGPTTPGACVVDAKKVGQTCGAPGQVCQANGTCACRDSACANPTPVCGAVTCEACTSDAQCQAAGKGGVCCDGSCYAGDCCGNSDCDNPTPICTQHTCSACTSTTQCGNREICDDGSCEACDVCPGAGNCTYESPQQAIEAGYTAGASEITARICPGTYTRVYKHVHEPDVTLIGAGDGNDPASNTILDDPGTNDPNPPDWVARFEGGTSTLRGVRVTGGTGGGVLNNFATLSVADCTITENAIASQGGGIQNNGVLNVTNVRVEGNSAANEGGGIFNFSGSTITFAGDNLVADNTLTNPNAAYRGSGISNQGTIHGIATVTIRDNDPANSQCYGCPA